MTELYSKDLVLPPSIMVDDTKMMTGRLTVTHEVEAAVSASTESSAPDDDSRKRKMDDATDVGTKKHRHVRRAATAGARREYLQQLEY